MKDRFSYGYASFTPVPHENLLYGAEREVPDLKRAIEQLENRINIFLGRNPGSLFAGRAATGRQAWL